MGGWGGAVHEGLAGELARLLHESLEAGILLDAGEVLVCGDGVRLAETEVYGLLQFVEGLGGVFAVCEGAGKVVVPCGVVRHNEDCGAAGGFHGGDVAAVDGGHELFAQLAVARPDVRHGPDRTRLLRLRNDCGGQRERGDYDAKFVHALILPYFAP